MLTRLPMHGLEPTAVGDAFLARTAVGGTDPAADRVRRPCPHGTIRPPAPQARIDSYVEVLMRARPIRRRLPRTGSAAVTARRSP
jgi:hypothetical protein